MDSQWEGAAAIWAALDDLANKDPEYYKQFIESTLSQGPPPLNAAASKKSQVSQESSTSKAFSNMISSFGKMGLTGDQTEAVQKPGKSRKNPKTESQKSSEVVTPKRSSLLDNDLGKSSIIASIIPADKRLDADELGGDLSEDVPICVTVPAAPSDTKTTSSNRKPKPLIEEI